MQDACSRAVSPASGCRLSALALKIRRSSSSRALVGVHAILTRFADKARHIKVLYHVGFLPRVCSKVFPLVLCCSDVMVKRRADEADLDATHEAKRIRPAVRDHLSHLSDELLLRVLSYLPVSQLATCQR